MSLCWVDCPARSGSRTLLAIPSAMTILSNDANSLPLPGLRSKDGQDSAWDALPNEKIDTYLLTATVSLIPIAGTVLPTTAAIWRTWTISSSNWSGNRDCGPSERAWSGW
jgi:hypothetical protein